MRLFPASTLTSLCLSLLLIHQTETNLCRVFLWFKKTIYLYLIVYKVTHDLYFNLLLMYIICIMFKLHINRGSLGKSCLCITERDSIIVARSLLHICCVKWSTVYMINDLSVSCSSRGDNFCWLYEIVLCCSIPTIASARVAYWALASHTLQTFRNTLIAIYYLLIV